MKEEYKKVLTIAGSDPSGGAGIQADIKAISAIGCYAASAITALTVQNTIGVTEVFPVPANVVGEQIEAVMDDLKPDVVKLGMLCNTEIVNAVYELLKHYAPQWIVLDPVMVSTSGHRLLSEEACALMKKKLMPLASIITPNLPEAKILGLPDKRNELGCKTILIKGGHQNGDILTDILIENEETLKIAHNRINTCNTHGTGCTLSSAVAAYLSKGMNMRQAVVSAEDYLNKAIEAGAEKKTGEGHGPVDFFFNINNK